MPHEPYLKEHEAWFLIYELSVATKGQAMINRAGHRLNGLCAAAIMLRFDDMISPIVEDKMLERAHRQVRKDRSPVACYLTRPGNWTNRVRNRYALQFAEETAPKETPC